MKAAPVVTAIVVTYNSRPHIDRALAGMHAAYQAGILRCIVVDNASKDGTAEYVEGHHRWVTLVRSSENLGFGRGCNLGFEQVRTPYVLIQNPDAVVEISALQSLVAFLELHEAAGIAGPAITESGGTLQAAGLMTTPLSLVRSSMGFGVPMKEERRILPGSAPFRTSWVCGAVMLIRSELFRRVGGFDPRFFLYFEETDLCRRITQEGAEIWAVGEAQVEHIGGASSMATNSAQPESVVSEHFYRSRFYYLVKHYGWFLAGTSEVISRALYTLRDWRYSAFNRTTGRGRRSSRPFLRLPALPNKSP